MVQIIIPGVPCGKARARVVRLRNGRTISYTPKKTETAEATIRAIYAQEYGDKEPLAGPLAVIVRAYFPIPKSANKALKEYAAKECLPYCKRPDADNCAKLCLDALNGTAFRDDASIYQLEVWKYYSNRPRLEIEVRAMNDLFPQGGTT